MLRSPQVGPITLSEPAQSSEPLKKKARLSEHDDPRITRQCADLETSLEVDHMILDYLAWQAIHSCLTTDQARRQSEDTHSKLLLVGDFLHLFQSRYQSYQFDGEPRFRILLLKFVTLFANRYGRTFHTPSLESLNKLRASNQERAKKWIGTEDRLPTAAYDSTEFESSLPLGGEELEANRAEHIAALGLPAEGQSEKFYGRPDCISLLDLLGPFMEVAAACQSVFESRIRIQWMHFVSEVMLQACLEQYLMFGASGTDPVDEAFSWGYKSKLKDDSESSTTMTRDARTNELFEDDEPSLEAVGWAKIRDSVLRDVFPPNQEDVEQQASPVPLVDHLYRVAAKYPMKRTEQKLHEYLNALAQCMPAPVLDQIQRRQLDGMSEAETSQFIRDCGLDPRKLFR